MIFIKNIKGNNERTVYLFNTQVYKYEKISGYRVQNICGKLITTKKFNTANKEEKSVYIANFLLFKRILENNIYNYYLFGILVRKNNLAATFYNRYLKKYKNPYDNVYILNANSGEIFLFFAYLANAFLKKNNSKNPLFIATKKYHTDILKLYFPDAQFMYIPEINLNLKQHYCENNGHKYYVIFTALYLTNFENTLRNNPAGTVHYFGNMCNKLLLNSSDFSTPDYFTSEDIKTSLKNKLDKSNLNTDNFLILAPEALTCKELPHNFWAKLATELHQKGYDIFLNITNSNNFISSCTSFPLSYRELFCLAQKAKAVISLRSGLTEFLIPAKIPNITIYTKFQRKENKSFSIDKVIAGFTMTKIPFVDKENIKELNIEKFKNENELIEKIITSLEILQNKKETLV